MKPTYQIVIESNGDTTTAKMVINGVEVKTAIAMRNPKDKHDWKMAANVAFDRLWMKDEKQVEQKQEGVFKVGDRVVIKSNAHRWIVGKVGRIVSVEGKLYGVETDEAHEILHTCGFRAKANHGWYCFADELSHEKPTKPEVREVERIAKVGEWVKIVKKDGFFGERYSIGDILTVEGVDCAGWVKLSCGGTAAMPAEYVVLEGYQPEGK